MFSEQVCVMLGGSVDNGICKCSVG
jgi:hypothetical protein